MTDIYLVDRPSRIMDLVAEQGASWPDDQLPIGIGFYQCTRLGSSSRDRGVSFLANPEGLRGELLSEILSGRISPLNQEPVLFGTDALPVAAQQLGTDTAQPQTLPLKRWLLTGLHPLDELAHLQIPLSRLNQKLRDCREIGPAVDLLLDEILKKVKEIAAPSVVFPIDSPLLVEFFYSILGPVPFGLGLREDRMVDVPSLSTIERAIISRRVLEEVLRRISSNPPDCNTILQCDSDQHLHGLTSLCRNLKAAGEAADITFRM